MILAIASKISYSSDVVELEPPKHVIFFISLFCSVCVSSRTWWSSAVWVHKSSTVALICRPVPECATWVWYLSLYLRITGHTCLSATVTNTMYFVVFLFFFMFLSLKQIHVSSIMLLCWQMQGWCANPKTRPWHSDMTWNEKSFKVGAVLLHKPEVQGELRGLVSNPNLKMFSYFRFSSDILNCINSLKDLFVRKVDIWASHPAEWDSKVNFSYK